MTSALELRRGTYRDSVTLMQVSRAVKGVEGVEDAFVAMATALNLGLLTTMGFEAPEDAGPNDMIVAIRAKGGAALESACARVEEALAAAVAPAPSGPSAGPVPRTVDTVEGATLALVSVAGPYVFAEAAAALESGLDVMIFSDNVPVAQEVLLKDRARAQGRVVMGPDCGTAVIGGAGLGFANTVRPGPVGIVAASGTGSQQLMCLLHAGGAGISHCIGVGGRDLSEEVGARSTLQALSLLDDDPATELIIVVSKPPAPGVAAEVARYAAGLGTPVELALLGAGQDDLTRVAARTLEALGTPRPDRWPSWMPDRAPAPRRGALRGLFCGGTLCDEAMVIASETLGPVASNIPLEPDRALPAGLRSSGHYMIDFGDDGLTAGRPHPMIDPSLRRERLAEVLAEPETGAVLLDVVLGHGAHPDPAAEIAATLRAAGEGSPPVVVSLCGTDLDGQGFAAQAHTLTAAGAEVYLSNAEAAHRAVLLTKGQPS